MDTKMNYQRTLWSMLLVIIGVVLALTNGEISEGGCDLTLTKPCRSNNTLCVPLQHVADGFIDCPDGSDEDCPDDWFICADLSRCIDRQFIQDGTPDCDDESDEACDEWQHECLCGLPRCIDIAKVGDGHLDCVEGSDELAIEKKSYICPSDLLTGQELLRRKRQIGKEERRNAGKGVITNYFSGSSGATLGVLTSTVFSFVNKGTTSEYLTKIEGTSIDGQYAQVTSVSSRTFFALPTRLRENQVNGLVSSIVKTTTSSGYTKTIVSRIYHTNIDGTYAQLVETETIGYVPTKTISMNIVTILQGEELHGTFLTHPDNSIATLQFSHLEGSLNPEPVAHEIVTVTGTYGKFIREDLSTPTTYSVFTGSYVKDLKTYVFFFGNSALPSRGGSQIEGGSGLKMKQGLDKSKVTLDMEKDMEVIMPSELKMLDMGSKQDLFIGEGMVDGHKVDGLFIAESEGFDVKGALKSGDGSIKMLTVTMGQPSTVAKEQVGAPTKINEGFTFFEDTHQLGNEQDNELDSSLLRGRKADIHGNEVISDADKINPTKPLPQDIPTFIIHEPNQDIADVLLREQIEKQSPNRPHTPSPKDKKEAIIVEDNNDKFNIYSIFHDSQLPTVTYYGFADFTTTIEDTVVVFSPNSRTTNVQAATETKSSLIPRVIPTKLLAESSQLNAIDQEKHTFSTVTTKVYNTVDLYPSGLVSSIGGTIVNDDKTTLFTTLVYGTYIQGQYAQVVRSTSSIIYLITKQSASLEPTALNDITMTKSPLFDTSVNDKSEKGSELSSGSLFGDIFDGLHTDNALGRSVEGQTNNKNMIIESDDKEKETIKQNFPILDESPSTVTYTLYTTYMNDGIASVVTNYKTTTNSPHFGFTTKSSPATLTHHTTKLISGVTKVQSSLEVVLTTTPPPSVIDNLFSNFFGADSASTDDDVSETFSETATESSAQGTTESPAISLDSSLNQEEDVNALFFPRTYYTTYTYFTTYHRLNTSSIVSSLDTVTNIITDEKQLEEYKALTPAIPTYPVTYWTTYTYWTTLVKDNSSMVTSSKKTISNVVNLTANETPTVVNEVLPIDATSIVPLISVEQTSTVDVTTYYTTYTYYTTATKGDSTVVTSRLETKSSIVTGSTPGLTSVLERPFGLLFDQSVTEAPATENLKTGLLSTIRGSTVIGGITTMFSTNVYGTFVDGLYVQIQSTTSEIIDQTSSSFEESKKAVVLTVDAGSVIENEITTHYTTQTVGTYVGGVYLTKLFSTSSLEGSTVSVTEMNPKQTGIVREIIGSVIYGTKTTFYHSTILGTLIDGIYAQKIESTSRFVSGPSIAFNLLSDTIEEEKSEKINPFPILEPSIQAIINPTPVLFATESLESMHSETTDTEESETPKHKNRLSFPIRTSSKRRPDSFPFIKRTSTFSKEEALSKVLAAPVEEEIPEVKATPTKTKAETKPEITKPDPEPTQSFRFGNPSVQPTRRFRFQEKDQRRAETPHKNFGLGEKPVPKINRPTEEKPKPPTQEKPKLSPIERSKLLAEEKSKITHAEIKPEPVEDHENFRPFRFGGKAPTNGTRSTLPFPKRKHTELEDSNSKKVTTGQQAQLLTTEKPKITTKVSVKEASVSKRPNPFAFPNRSDDKRKNPRPPVKPEPSERGGNLNIRRPKPIPTTPTPPKTPRTPRPKLGGLLPRRRPVIPRLNEEESIIDPVYIHEDGSEVTGEDLPGMESFSSDYEYYDDEEAISRKKRQVDDFGNRVTSRGARRFERNQNSNSDQVKIAPSPKQEKQPFTLANPRAARVRSAPKRPAPKPEQSQQPQQTQRPTPARATFVRPSKSRNTLPFKPRENIQRVAPQLESTQTRGTFRRPESNNRFKISNRFSTEEKNIQNDNSRRPSIFTANRNRMASRPPPSKGNPIQSFLDRPKPVAKPKEKEVTTKFDGNIDITDSLTVTREVPVTTTIPLLENGQTIEKEVITASYSTEIFRPDQITKTEINGIVKLLLSTVESKQKVTRVFIQPIETTIVTYVPVFLEGQRTSTETIIPTTIFSIVTVTGPKNGNDVQDLLKLLLLQQQQQNPLLAAFGIGGGQQPSTQLHTRIYVTTVTNLISTEIPIIFRGKPIRTTVVETNVREITTSEVSTETLLGHGGNQNPLGQLLPLILQNQLNRKARDVGSTQLPIFDDVEVDSVVRQQKYYPVYIGEDGVRPLSDLESIFDYGTNALNINSAVNEIERNEYFEATPPLQTIYRSEKNSVSKNSFLSKGPAESTPLSRKVRSAQRGDAIRQRLPIRKSGARKIKTSADEQILQDISGVGEKEFINDHRNNAPTTFFTTFTYYTTLIDDADREYVQSSEETITQVATFGNIKFDDFTRTQPSSIQSFDHTSIVMFKPEDAIIPGMPRPVPDPIFDDPKPPHGPVIRHDSRGISRKPARTIKPKASKINLRGQSTNFGLSKPITVHPRDSEASDTQVDNVLQSEGNLPHTHEVMELEEREVEQPVNGSPGDHKRVRITLTKRRPIRISNTAIFNDPTTVSTPGGKRVVITRRLPQSQAIAIASPVDPFIGTVNTLYTVYSYVYSMFENAIPFSVSTRVVTVSNSIRPTLVEVPFKFQTVPPTSSLFTIEEGQKIATLGERITNGYTTQIYLHSATLANIRPGTLQRVPVDQHSLNELPHITDDIIQSSGLQSSLRESENTQSIPTPLFSRQSSRKTQKGPLIKAPSRASPAFTEQIFKDQNSLDNEAIHVLQTRKRGDIRFADRATQPIIVTPSHAKELSLASARRNQLHTQRRRPTTSIPEELELLEETIGEVQELAKEQPLESVQNNFDNEKPIGKQANLPDIFASIFENAGDAHTEETTLGTTEQSITRETTSFILSLDKSPRPTITEEVTEFSTTSEAPSTTSPPTKPTRSPVRRDDIPIVRRPTNDNQSKVNVTEHRLRFTTTHKSIPDIVKFPLIDKFTITETPTTFATPVETEKVEDATPIEYYDNEYYDEAEYDSADNTTSLPPAKDHSSLFDFNENDKVIATDKHEKGALDFDIFNTFNISADAEELESMLPEFEHVEKLTTVLSSNVIETTSSSLNFLPILGGEQITTSSLRSRFNNNFRFTKPNVIISSSATIPISQSLFTTKHSFGFDFFNDNSVGLFEDELQDSFSTSSMKPPSSFISTPSTDLFPTTTSEILSSKLFRSLTPDLINFLSADIFDIFHPKPLDDEPPLSESLSEDRAGGRAVMGSLPTDQLLGGAPSPVGTFLSISGRQNLATKIMNNGVEVIVAEDKTKLEPSLTGLVRATVNDIRRPTTLPPSTLSNQMLLLASSPAELKYQTYYTTFTYYNTIMADGKPTVVSSRETISNIISTPYELSGSFVEKTKINLDTSTYLTTQTFTRTVGDFLNRETITSEEVITQIVVTEAPSVSRSRVKATPVLTTLVTKTYFTTFTYYRTYVNELGTSVDTETVVSSDVITETSVTSLKTQQPEISITKAPLIGINGTPVSIFATKTFFTTSTYFTTILEGDETITSSHLEVTSNVLTEPITTVLKTSDTLATSSNLIGGIGNIIPSTYDEQYERTQYISMKSNIFKELRTLFATFTHYTTLIDGQVESSEVTKTQILTSIITSSNIPSSLLIHPDRTLSDSEVTSTANNIFESGLFGSLFGESSVELEPSYTESTSQGGITGMSSSMKESSGKATVLVEEGSESGTFVVKDSTTSATLLIRPTEEISSSVDIFEQLFTSNTVAMVSSELPFAQTTVIPLRSDSDSSDSKPIEPTSVQDSESVSSSTLRLDPPPVVQEEAVSDSVSASTSETSNNEAPTSVDNASESGNFGFGINPMLTAAVAGLIGNTFAGRLAGQAAIGSRRKDVDQIMPKNAIVAAENEPLLIPIGGVGASLSRSQSQSITPDQGFIPLRRPEQVGSFEFVPTGNEFTAMQREEPQHTQSEIQPSVTFESFGPSFKPPLTTQVGFTGMTQVISPSKTSVISGEETIFFGGFKNLNLPPPGKPAPTKVLQQGEELRPQPVPVSIDDDTDKSISHLSLTPSESQQFNHHVRLSPKPSLVSFNLEEGGENIYASESDHSDLVHDSPTESHSTIEVEEAVGPVGGTGILSTELPFRFKNDGERTTIVRGSSTVMSGDTTIYDSLFTKPSKDSIPSVSVSLERGLNGKITKYITNTEGEPQIIVKTKTHYDFIDGFPMSRTEVVTHTRGFRTLVSTIVETTTEINELETKTSIVGSIKPATSSESKTRLATVTVTPVSVPANANDVNLISNVEDYQGANAGANLGYAEENEISRVVESQSPDQDLSNIQTQDNCNSQCGKDEICKTFDQDHMCVCKPGYSRRNHNDVCKRSKSFEVAVILDRFSDNKLSFSPELTNYTHPATQFLIKEVNAGLDKAMKDSDLGGHYRANTVLAFEETITEQLQEPSLVARVKIDLEDDEGEEQVSFSSFIPFVGKSPISEQSVQAALEESLNGSNYSLGGGDVFAREAYALAAEDFDECQSPDHHDCHENAECLNTAGSFTCRCLEPYIDVSSKEPGRQCTDPNTCSFCNYHGKCQEDSKRELSCVCNNWFHGEHCQINMKVLLISVVSLGAFLLLLLCIFLVFCCRRSKDDKQPTFLTTGKRGEPSTLDRRAMIHDSSSECSEEVTRMPSVNAANANRLPPMPRTPQADYSIGRRSGMSSMSKDRSVTVHTSMPPVLIPRIKGYNGVSAGRQFGDKENQLKTAEATLVNILDGSATHVPRDMEANASVHSFGRIPPSNHKSRSRERLDEEDRHHHVSSRHRQRQDEDDEHVLRSRSNDRVVHPHHEGSTFRSRSIDRLDRSTQDLTSDFEANSLRYGNRTVSQARSYDETTIRPPIRSLRNESFRSRDISSQVISDGMPTNAERDGNSTIVYPPMQLYRPVREADSMSDLTAHPKNDFF